VASARKEAEFATDPKKKEKPDETDDAQAQRVPERKMVDGWDCGLGVTCGLRSLGGGVVWLIL